MRYKECAFFLRNNSLPVDFNRQFEHLYLGDEFCERRLPSILDLENLLNRKEYRNLKFTLVTPYLTDAGIEKLSQLLRFIVSEEFILQGMVINDWGTLMLLREHHCKFQIALGRILVSRYLKEEHGEGLQGLRDQNSIRKPYFNFPDPVIDSFKRENISALEFNSYHHLLLTRQQLMNHGFKVHTYYPFIYLTTSRYCSANEEFSAYFRKSIQSCDKSCDKLTAQISNSKYSHSIFINGNAFFVRERNQGVLAELEADRLICNDSFRNSLSMKKEHDAG